MSRRLWVRDSPAVDSASSVNFSLTFALFALDYVSRICWTVGRRPSFGPRLDLGLSVQARRFWDTNLNGEQRLRLLGKLEERLGIVTGPREITVHLVMEPYVPAICERVCVPDRRRFSFDTTSLFGLSNAGGAHPTMYERYELNGDTFTRTRAFLAGSISLTAELSLSIGGRDCKIGNALGYSTFAEIYKKCTTVETLEPRTTA
ncbi:hypothetical protein DFH06DRAFT_1348173 [Mycena polygramma]|nr:hypothetical protein DFH06DRAFT_1348173 [Mycena polygramma]